MNVLAIHRQPLKQLEEIYRLWKKGGHLITATDCCGELIKKSNFQFVEDEVLHPEPPNTMWLLENKILLL